jgi:uncharacterized protein YfaS (alpha-2-macroglobulin family)
MKTLKPLLPVLILIFIWSCRNQEKPAVKLPFRKNQAIEEISIPINKGFSDYISGYTSGMVSVNTAIEIRFTPEFAASTRKDIPAGLFTFEPAIRGKAEWKDNLTLVFKPNRILDPETEYTGTLSLYKLAAVKENLRSFPLRIRTLKRDFIVTIGTLESSAEGDRYTLHGEITASDYIPSGEVESYLNAKVEKRKADIIWDHSDVNVHRFNVVNIIRSKKPQKLEIEWDGNQKKVRQKGSTIINIPPENEFSVIDLIVDQGGNTAVNIVFSDPIDASQEKEGLIRLGTLSGTPIEISTNIVSLFPSPRPDGIVELIIDKALRNQNGTPLGSEFRKNIDFSPVPPSIELVGNGVVLPASQNLVFPFKTANLKAVDLKIIKVYENNLPWFLQENEINTGYSVKRFGRPVYTGKIDLVEPGISGQSPWTLHTVDLEEYINVEPGILYRVELGMRPSYSLYPCTGEDDFSKYEDMLDMSEENNREFWDDPENYYSDSDDYIYYSFGFNWRDRDNPCKAAYFNPDRKVTRNILASNFGIIAKKGQDNKLHVIVNDLLSALPLSEVNIDVYDFQLQKIASGNTGQDGSVSINCGSKPFLLIATKDRDRNYLKLNDGSSLSLSSFDVSGVQPEKGIKAFIYGERDVWRPGDSIFLSVFIRDLNNALPQDHPVQFELVNPLEQRVDYQVKKSDHGNLIVFPTVTSGEAVTGNYSARITVGGATFTKRIRIETIKPNRLKIDLSFPGNLLGGDNLVSRGTLKVKWLNGSTAGNLGSTVEYLLKPTKTIFKGYGQYEFDDPSIRFYSESVKVFDGKVDENGNASFTFDPGREINAPGMLNAVFTVRVAETGGDESITQTVLKYAPFPVFTGINLPGLQGKGRTLFTDTDNRISIVTLDPEGNPLNSDVDITIYKISYRWWWESDDEDLASFISNNIYKPVITSHLKTVKGEGSFSFRINKKDWGRYLIRATSAGGHSTGKIVLIDWPWEYGMKENSEGATLLSINTDKEKYFPGDEVKLTFPAPENARAIVTLENATSVLQEIYVNTTKGNTVVSFKAKPEMAPDVYAYVTVIQPHAQTINDMPMRLYGIVPVMVEDPDTRLNPQITAADEMRSGKSFKISVSELNRKPMTYTVAVVDEGLLDITGFKTPDPWNYFYAREALGVQTWDLYDMVLGAYGGILERLFAIGGDEGLIDRAANKARRFEPVVKFFGPFSLSPGKTAVHNLTLPQYTGSVKVMVVAGNDRAFGFAEKSVFVKDPLMVLATVPRVAGPGEKLVLPVTLFVQNEGIDQVDLSVETNDYLSVSPKVKTVKVTGQGEKDIEFTCTAGEKTGISTIKITASGGGERAEYDLNLAIRSPNQPETRTELHLLKQGEKWETSFTPFGIEGSNAASLEVSTLPSVNLEKWLDYLVNYPYGCTEQIVSAAFPQLWLNNLSGPGAQTGMEVAKNIKEAVNKIVSRQMYNGGIALWPGNYQPDNWVTSYTGHFMAEAEKMGYVIPGSFRRRWLDYQKKNSREWNYDPKFKQTANDQAYRLFTLSLAGDPDRGAMNRLRETEDLPRLSRWLLAASFALSGRPEVAENILDIRDTETEQEYSDYYYGSRLRDEAIVLYTLSLLKKQEEALPLLRSVCNEFNSGSWFSTQSMAWGLLAYMKFAENITGDNSGQSLLSFTFNGLSADQTLPAGKVFVKNLDIRAGNNTLSIENKSPNPVYINLVRKGTPLTTEETSADNGLEMKVNYINVRMEEIDPVNLKQGSDFMMVTRVTNITFTNVDNIALSQVMPSGWEIRNTRLFEANYGIKESKYDYRDIGDDRVNTYFNLGTGETKTFVVVLNAAYKGEFYQPAIRCEAMYTGNCYSRIPGRKVRVTGEAFE